MDGLGSAMIDAGQPFGGVGSIVDDGSEGSAPPLSGYSIIGAESMDAAKALSADHPFLPDGNGELAIDP